MDHATGIVVGETAVIGDNCTILHAVTLGGTGKERGDRHPKIGHAVRARGWCDDPRQHQGRRRRDGRLAGRRDRRTCRRA